MDLRSIVFFDKASQVVIGENMRLKKSVIKVVASNVHFGKESLVSQARVIFTDSRIEIGDAFIIRDIMMSVSGKSAFKAGNHLLMAKQGIYKSGFYCADASVTLGDNVNIRAEMVCHSSVFISGDNVFLNEGTQIRCTNNIQIGSNILFSYECILFDTNTHSLDAKDRLQEMIDGYPNQAIQSGDIKKKVKTAPIVIGNDVWVGTRSIILKGTTIGNEVIVGAATVLSGQSIEDKKVVYGNPAQWR